MSPDNPDFSYAATRWHGHDEDTANASIYAKVGHFPIAILEFFIPFSHQKHSHSFLRMKGIVLP